jgi:uroporphyrinogen-III synthase
MGRAEPALRGIAVLLTRPPSRVTSLAARLRALGASVEARPTIELAPPHDPGPARRAAREVGRYDWIVLTSPTGARCFLEALAAAGARTALRARFAVVGPGTAAALAGAAPVGLEATDSRAEGLARVLAPALRPGERVLLVGPERARPLLSQALSGTGAEVEAVAFYRNEPARDVVAIAHDVAGGRYDVLVLSSPSSLERLLASGARPRDELHAALARLCVVAIGPITAHALADAGLAARAVADRPTDDGIVDAIGRGLGLAL